MYFRGLRLFYSYAHEDQKLQEEVKKYLRMLEREGLIQGWDDRMIGAGAEWEGQILEALERADVVLLLISADFLSSDYCWDVEMARALMRHNAKEALVVPIILRPCPWQGAPFAKLQCLPRDALPVVSWKPTDEGYLNVAEGLRDALKERIARKVERPNTKQSHVERALDGAIAKTVPVDRVTDVVAMIRRLDSEGLRAVLETESGYSAAPEDVQIKCFNLYFPSNQSGDLESAKVTLRLEGFDFDPPQQEKTIEVPPEADSLTCVFLVRAQREGPLVLSLEVRQHEVTLAQQLLRTNGDRYVARRTLSPYFIVSVGYIHPAEEVIAKPPAPASAPPVPMAIPSGVVRHDSHLYINHPDEVLWCAELEKPGALICIRSPRGFGKSLLIARLLAYARGEGYRTVAIDLICTDQKFFADPELFMQWFCASVGRELGLRVRKEDYWEDIFEANDNSSDYFETYLLKPDPTPLVLAIDNFDRIFDHAAIEANFCALLRSWHERARSNPLWERFRLVLSHSLEPYPFNVGLTVELGELEPAQVHRLVELHGLKLSEEQEGQLLALIGGHPYLVGKALYELAHGLSFSTFLEEAATEAGIYGEHLRSLLKSVEDHPELGDALRQVVNSPEPVKLRSEEAFKLESLGVVVPQGNLERSRCDLYYFYLADRLAR